MPLQKNSHADIHPRECRLQHETSSRRRPMRRYTYNSTDGSEPPVSISTEEGRLIVVKSTPVKEGDKEETAEDMVRLYLDSSSDIVYVYEDDSIGTLSNVINSDSVYIAHPYSEDHKGTDLVAKEGSEVLSVTDGTVDDVGYDDERGNYIDIRSESGEVYGYEHLQELPDFKTGDKVNEKQVIGKVGNTGNSTGPHLHLSLKDKDGNDKNIEIYFADYPKKDDEP